MLALQSALKFNDGGHINHSIFWTNLSPNGGGEPTGELADAINAAFGSFEAFKTTFNTKSAPIQGSGWGCLDTIRPLVEWSLRRVPTKTPSQPPQAWCRCWEWMCGSMPTTCSTKTFAPTT